MFSDRARPCGRGSVSADVIEEAAGPDGFAKKHIGAPRYQDFTVQVDTSLTSNLYDWINASLISKPQRKSGAVVAHDFNYEAKSRREFFSALISEVGFPPCDATSKDPAYLTVKFAPEYTRYTKASGKLAAASSKIQKAWLPSNFRLTIDGLDCTRVSKINAFTIKQTITERIPGKIEFPNLTVWLPEVSAATWLAWHEEFVISGMNSDDREKSGRLELLAPDLKETLLTIELNNVGIFDINLPGTAAADQIPMVRVDLYCERMALFTGKSAIAKRVVGSRTRTRRRRR